MSEHVQQWDRRTLAKSKKASTRQRQVRTQETGSGVCAESDTSAGASVIARVTAAAIIKNVVAKVAAAEAAECDEASKRVAAAVIQNVLATHAATEDATVPVGTHGVCHSL